MLLSRVANVRLDLEIAVHVLLSFVFHLKICYLPNHLNGASMRGCEGFSLRISHRFETDVVKEFRNIHGFSPDPLTYIKSV